MAAVCEWEKKGEHVLFIQTTHSYSYPANVS